MARWCFSSIRHARREEEQGCRLCRGAGQRKLLRWDGWVRMLEGEVEVASAVKKEIVRLLLSLVPESNR
jgi:negative regulator of sigma E activity